MTMIDEPDLLTGAEERAAAADFLGALLSRVDKMARPAFERAIVHYAKSVQEAQVASHCANCSAQSPDVRDASIQLGEFKVADKMVLTHDDMRELHAHAPFITVPTSTTTFPTPKEAA